ncbi:DUF11 domain-containing protein [Flagellimonas meishanensis]|uniref:DUF11 domain-containing protein n=1 Tax=Flagellimonas meishanensis TaxID=2873264 RepID=UPI001CA784D7|nr:DUF11 domain-containing protein [[Muricauda] meishanensis]
MKREITIAFISLIGILSHAQDLELDVHVLPTSVLGDPALFNITVRNIDLEPAEGVEVQIELKKGLKFSSFTPNSFDFDPDTGHWKIGKVERHKAMILSIIANYVAKENAILVAEITKSNGIDPDSTPGNGVDTNGNGKIVNDKDDEDDGDAAQIGPFK